MKDEGRTGKEDEDNLVDGKYSIQDLVNLEQLRNIFEKFTESTGFTIGFVDHPGLNILIATGWRDICTKFHRACPASIRNCKKSNTHLFERSKELGQIVVEECDNGLVDCATPIIIKGKHIASLVTGQLLLKQPDIERFKRQARMFGYDEQEYLEAIKDIPVVSEEKLKSVTSFFAEIATVISELGYTNLSLKEKAVLLDKEITERERAEETLRASEAELHDNYFAQSAINMILSESLEDVPLEVILQKALNVILSIPWISFESIGSIHLVEDERGILVMKAQNSLPEALIGLCSKIPFGKCLCGRAALTQGIEFAGHVDERHEICYEGMTPHGHYSVPIPFGGKTLGVLNIYLQEGHARNKREEEFLLAVADTLAGIIVRKKMEDDKEKLHHQLLQAQKMEAVGQLAGGIAHDFNNILTAIVSYGSLLKMKLTIDDPLSSYVDHILSSSERAANLTHSLLAFSRKQIINPRPVDLNQIVRKVEKLLVRIISEDIELKTLLTGRDLTVMADPLQMEQIFMNLATNARDAMPKGGTLEIETKIVDLDETFIKTHGYGKRGRYALISFSDSGIGMDEETRDRIFEPFFTTKEVGKGTGLGLSMVYGIIKQHDGFINVYSEPEKGTTFNIYLPQICTKPEDAQPEVVDIIRVGIETILLAEDNSEVRASTKALLEEFGYKIIEATDGEDAIGKFNRYRDRIKLVILDVIMPKKNGKEVYKEIKKISPDIKVIFTSGYTADIIHQKGILSEGSGFIHKPISPQVLLKKVREILDRDKE